MVTVVGLLNALLSILFPLWPWEPFFVMPLIFEILKCRGHLSGVILFLTVFAAVFCLAHGAGFAQAVDTFVYGGQGICVPALPGAPKDIDTGSMCKMMAIHIFSARYASNASLFASPPVAMGAAARPRCTALATDTHLRCEQ